jgi:HD-GYP domain-containing protein (c-di-GMP phosphodiesterase class II)
VRLYPYYTDRVLRRIPGLAHLAPIASSVHERMDGGGYPRGIAGDAIPLLGRYLAAAHRYRVLVSDRPHRPRVTDPEAGRALRSAALAGELDATAVDAVLAASGQPGHRSPSAPAGLTPREMEVLALAARGLTTKHIAHVLGMAPKTAGNHIERIYTKIDASSRAEATLFAMRNGIV